MNEYTVTIRIDTNWHEPHNATTSNTYTEFESAETGKQAVSRVIRSFGNLLSNPNKSIHLVKVQKL